MNTTTDLINHQMGSQVSLTLSYKKLILTVIFIFSIALVGIAAYLDMRPYFNAMAEHNSVYQLELSGRKLNYTGDFSNYMGCVRASSSIGPEAERTCLLSIAPLIKSHSGATLIAGAAGRFLIKNPEDNELKVAALDAIRMGWKDIEAQKSELDSLDKVHDMHDKSIIWRLIDGPQESWRTFEKYADRLNKYEMFVKEPKLVQEQWIKKYPDDNKAGELCCDWL